MSNHALYAAVTLMVTTLCSTTVQAAGPIQIENALAQCVTLQPGARVAADQQVVTQARVDVKKSIAECGCKSAIATYTSEVVLDGDHRSFLQRGAIVIKASGPQSLTLASSAQLLGERPVVLSLACASPG